MLLLKRERWKGFLLRSTIRLRRGFEWGEQEGGCEWSCICFGLVYYSCFITTLYNLQLSNLQVCTRYFVLAFSAPASALHTVILPMFLVLLSLPHHPKLIYSFWSHIGSNYVLIESNNRLASDEILLCVLGVWRDADPTRIKTAERVGFSFLCRI